MFCIVAWYGNLTLANKNRFASLIKVASKISGRSQAQRTDLYHKQVFRKATSLLECKDHPLWIELKLLPTGRRFKVPVMRTKRYKVSSVPAAFYMLNSR